MPGLTMDVDQIPPDPLFKVDEEDEDDEGDLDEEQTSGDGRYQRYQPRTRLSQQTVMRWSLKQLVVRMDAGIIDLDPEYQRDVVWTAERMTGLINSLMENYYIPPIILNRKARPDYDGTGPRETMVCVDGKQRLSSVRAFVKGLIPCNDHRGKKWWFCNATNKARNILSEQEQREFLEKEFTAVEYRDLEGLQEEDIFARVQMGIPLTPAEKMRAVTGPWQELAKTYVEDFPAIFSLMNTSNKQRGRDFQYALACFSQIQEVQHPTTAKGIPLLRSTLIWIEKFIGNHNTFDDETKSHLGAVFRKFDDLIKQDPEVFVCEQTKLKGNKSFAPIELIAVVVLISMYKDERSDQLLLGDIMHMRQHIRELLPLFRMNEPTWKILWAYIDNLESYRGAVNASTVPKTAKKRKSKAQTNQPLVEPSAAPPTPRATPASPIAEPARPVEVRSTGSESAKRSAPSDDNAQEQQKRPRIDPTTHETIKPEPVDSPHLPPSPLPPFPTNAPPTHPPEAAKSTVPPVADAIMAAPKASYHKPTQPSAPPTSKPATGKQMARRSGTTHVGAVPVRRTNSGGLSVRTRVSPGAASGSGSTPSTPNTWATVNPSPGLPRREVPPQPSTASTPIVGRHQPLQAASSRTQSPATDSKPALQKAQEIAQEIAQQISNKQKLATQKSTTPRPKGVVKEHARNRSSLASITDELVIDLTSDNETNTPEAQPVQAQPVKASSSTGRTSATAAKPIVCENTSCDQTFTRIEHMKRHVKSVHTKNKSFQCDGCGRRFSRSDNMVAHQRRNCTGR